MHEIYYINEWIVTFLYFETLRRNYFNFTWYLLWWTIISHIPCILLDIRFLFLYFRLLVFYIRITHSRVNSKKFLWISGSYPLQIFIIWFRRTEGNTNVYYSVGCSEIFLELECSGVREERAISRYPCFVALLYIVSAAFPSRAEYQVRSRGSFLVTEVSGRSLINLNFASYFGDDSSSFFYIYGNEVKLVIFGTLYRSRISFYETIFFSGKRIAWNV